jgi:hypothetical protein
LPPPILELPFLTFEDVLWILDYGYSFAWSLLIGLLFCYYFIPLAIPDPIPVAGLFLGLDEDYYLFLKGESLSLIYFSCYFCFYFCAKISFGSTLPLFKVSLKSFASSCVSVKGLPVF